MTGIKYKLAHKRAEQENWNITEHTQKKLLIRILEGLAIQLKGEMNENTSKNNIRDIILGSCRNLFNFRL